MTTTNTRQQTKPTRVMILDLYGDGYDLDALDEIIDDEDDMRVALCGMRITSEREY